MYYSGYSVVVNLCMYLHESIWMQIRWLKCYFGKFEYPVSHTQCEHRRFTNESNKHILQAIVNTMIPPGFGN